MFVFLENNVCFSLEYHAAVEVPNADITILV